MEWNERATIEALPQDVDGWRFSFEYPGVWTWRNAALPNGWLAATPFWSEDTEIQVEWQTIDGDVFPLDGVAYSLTGDPEKDAAAYVEAIRPALAHSFKTF
jgi:hypothetical protein